MLSKWATLPMYDMIHDLDQDPPWPLVTLERNRL